MSEKVFVTGIGMVTPVGHNSESSWSALLKSRSGIAPITAFDTSDFATTIAGEVPDFDPESYVDRKQARRLDRFAQFAVAASSQALAQANLDPRDGVVDPTRIGVIIGSGIGGLTTLSEQMAVLSTNGPGRISPFLVPMMLSDMGPAQVSIIFGAKGPNYCTVTACSSGADSIGLALQMIRRGDIDIAIAGGAEAPICPITIAGFNSCMALSKRNSPPDRASSPFDANRDGFVMGEGAGVLVIETASSATKRNAQPIAELVGYGASSDANHVTQPDPDADGATRAMKIALRDAEMQPSDISYINAHGTSTPLNDRLETLAIKNVFGNEAYKVKISSTKSMTGHLLGAAGGIEAAITVLAIAKGVCPPTINLETPDPDCDLDYTPHIPHRGTVKAAMSNNLGFGGHNASLIFRQID